MKKISYFLFFPFFLLLTSVVFAQDEEGNLCTKTLKDAQKAYDNGILENIPKMLEPCLQNGFSRSEKLQAYRLQILALLFLDESSSAESSLLKLLKEDPEYKVNPALDPVEFITLYNSYRTLPLYSIGIMGGLNTTQVQVFEPYGVHNTETQNGKYKSAMGFQIGITADILLKNRFQFSPGFFYHTKSYRHSNLLLGYTNLEVVEAQSWLDIPLLLKYTVGKKKLRGFIELGPQASLLLRSTSTFERTDDVTGSNQAVGPSIDTKELRHKLNYSAVAGIGVRYKLGYGYVVLSARYAYGLRNIANPEERYSNNELLYKYGYVDDNFTLNSMVFSVGYFKSFYKPKKLKTNVVE